ncbi:hypothetical protein [Bradyrhizobium sp. 145]|uniref:hypothetical protein n=1 Tax=Bradyrhizobium sp. 145 TaxID=2782621 RepID=UPI001FF95A77|nr:hypothetical protein [Bradyrhizobium sp. 145]MCK1686728.1 hypothetical protein [Bradyrhizobium sp. 145]
MWALSLAVNKAMRRIVADFGHIEIGRITILGRRAPQCRPPTDGHHWSGRRQGKALDGLNVSREWVAGLIDVARTQ